MSDKYVLAMYDIRGKQEFIFKTNHLQEIIGASAIIRDCYKDYLYPAALKVMGKGIYHGDTEFTEKGFIDHINEGYIGEVVYDGGGNFLLLFKKDDIFKSVTYEFTKEVLQKVGTLKILGSFVPIDDFSNFKHDRERLYAQHRKDEANQSCVEAWGTLPIVQVDPVTSLPYIGTEKRKGSETKVTIESSAKYEKYDLEVSGNQKNTPNACINEKVLDAMVKQKGEDSHLAIIYIDGNSMGAKVQECCKNLESYEDCIRELRRFSKDIQKNYIDDRLADIDAYLDEKNSDNSKQFASKRRIVLGAGDEINLICNAFDALQIAKVYLDGLVNVKKSDGSSAECSSCAGIAIFKSHTPYADAYRIAEECCESGKDVMKRKGISNACFVDYHYIQGAIDVNLESIREKENTKNNSRPWLFSIGDSSADISDLYSLSEIESIVAELTKLGRSNVKGLAEHARKGVTNLKLELNRMYAHMTQEKRKDFMLINMMNDTDGDRLKAERYCKMIYDIVIVYDLWFKKEN